MKAFMLKNEKGNLTAERQACFLGYRIYFDREEAERQASWYDGWTVVKVEIKEE